MAFERIGIVVGLAAEARIARRLAPRVAVGGGTSGGAADATRRLVADGVTGLISFGLAGGLDPSLQPGAILVPHCVLTGGLRFPTDPALSQLLGEPTPHDMLGADAIVADAAEKQLLWRTTGAAAVDLESGAVARIATEQSLPFAVLRVICDPAQRSLPPAALIALDARGAIGLWRVFVSILRDVRQVSPLLALASDAARARRALVRHADDAIRDKHGANHRAPIGDAVDQ